MNVLNVFDRFRRGRLARRAFLDWVSRLTVGGVAARSILEMLNPVNVAAQVEPPISWTCPMVGALMPDGTFHADVLEAEKGICPICGMPLVPIRLDSFWTCPVHAVIAQSKPGKCPIDKTRDLIQVTMAVTWTCQSRPDIDVLNRGTCPDGSPMEMKRTPRPHGNHNPQHGGLLFMAPDNWHHFEGTHPAPGVFRGYFYDDFAKPLAVDQLRAVKGRVVTKESFDAKTRQTTEQSAFALILSPDGKYMEARFAPLALPAQITAKIQFKPDMKEDRFDFTFSQFSKEPQ